MVYIVKPFVTHADNYDEEEGVFKYQVLGILGDDATERDMRAHSAALENYKFMLVGAIADLEEKSGSLVGDNSKIARPKIQQIKSKLENLVSSIDTLIQQFEQAAVLLAADRSISDTVKVELIEKLRRSVAVATGTDGMFFGKDRGNTGGVVEDDQPLGMALAWTNETDFNDGSISIEDIDTSITDMGNAAPLDVAIEQVNASLAKAGEAVKKIEDSQLDAALKDALKDVLKHDVGESEEARNVRKASVEHALDALTIDDKTFDECLAARLVIYQIPSERNPELWRAQGAIMKALSAKLANILGIQGGGIFGIDGMTDHVLAVYAQADTSNRAVIASAVADINGGKVKSALDKLTQLAESENELIAGHAANVCRAVARERAREIKEKIDRTGQYTPQQKTALKSIVSKAVDGTPGVVRGRDEAQVVDAPILGAPAERLAAALNSVDRFVDATVSGNSEAVDEAMLLVGEAFKGDIILNQNNLRMRQFRYGIDEGTEYGFLGEIHSKIAATAERREQIKSQFSGQPILKSASKFIPQEEIDRIINATVGSKLGNDVGLVTLEELVDAFSQIRQTRGARNGVSRLLKTVSSGETAAERQNAYDTLRDKLENPRFRDRWARRGNLNTPEKRERLLATLNLIKATGDNVAMAVADRMQGNLNEQMESIAELRAEINDAYNSSPELLAARGAVAKWNQEFDAAVKPIKDKMAVLRTEKKTALEDLDTLNAAEVTAQEKAEKYSSKMRAKTKELRTINKELKALKRELIGKFKFALYTLGATLIGAAIGAIVGVIVGGPAGAALGAAIGANIGFAAGVGGSLYYDNYVQADKHQEIADVREDINTLREERKSAKASHVGALEDVKVAKKEHAIGRRETKKKLNSVHRVLGAEHEALAAQNKSFGISEDGGGGMIAGGRLDNAVKAVDNVTKMLEAQVRHKTNELGSQVRNSDEMAEAIKGLRGNVSPAKEVEKGYDGSPSSAGVSQREQRSPAGMNV